MRKALRAAAGTVAGDANAPHAATAWNEASVRLAQAHRAADIACAAAEEHAVLAQRWAATREGGKATTTKET